jgi:hypothetical protein
MVRLAIFLLVYLSEKLAKAKNHRIVGALEGGDYGLKKSKVAVDARRRKRLEALGLSVE